MPAWSKLLCFGPDTVSPCDSFKLRLKPSSIGPDKSHKHKDSTNKACGIRLIWAVDVCALYRCPKGRILVCMCKVGPRSHPVRVQISPCRLRTIEVQNLDTHLTISEKQPAPRNLRTLPIHGGDSLHETGSKDTSWRGGREGGRELWHKQVIICALWSFFGFSTLEARPCQK